MHQAAPNEDSTRSSLLMQIAGHSEHPSWEEFGAFYARLIKRFVGRLGFRDRDGEDLVQETLVAIVAQLPHYRKRPGIRFRSWVFAIASHKANDFRRAQFRKARREAALERSDGVEPFLQSLWETEWKRSLLQAALERLRPDISTRHWQILELIIEEKTVRQIAQTLDLTPFYVSVAKHRLVSRLQKAVQELRSAWDDDE